MRQEPDVALLFDQLADQIGELGGELAGSAGTIASGAFSVIGTLFLVVLLALFMVLDSHKIMVWLSRLVPSRFRDQSILFQEGVARSFGGFIRAQTVLALIMFGLVMIVGLIARALGGMEYIFVTAVVSGLLMFIPMIGPPLALVPPIFVAFLTSENWLVALVAAIVLVVVQGVLVNAIQPKMMQESLGLHPILLFDERRPDEVKRVLAASDDILSECIACGGSVTGEHGIGVEKLSFMTRLFTEDDVAVMKRFRDALNPRGLLSPGKMFPTAGACGMEQVHPGRRAAL